jgi:hypothetical protein
VNIAYLVPGCLLMALAVGYFLWLLTTDTFRYRSAGWGAAYGLGALFFPGLMAFVAGYVLIARGVAGQWPWQPS